MADRLLGIVASAGHTEAIELMLRDEVVRASWCVWSGDDLAVYNALVNATEVEPLLDRLERRFGHDDNFRAMLTQLSAVLPRPPEEPAASAKQAASAADAPPKKVPQRVSRAELHEEVSGAAKLNRLFLVQVVLATIVAAIGLFRNLPAVVIGAMVIAPLLGPNIALALGTTLGDWKLIQKSIRTTLAGVGLAFGLAMIYGALFDVDEGGAEVAARTSVALSDILLALASGVAGTLAFTTGVSSSLVGVMVAIALMPPTVVAGSLLGAGEWQEFSGASLLLAVNIVCVNLAAVVTFLVQGIRPSSWWEAERSRRLTRRAITIWAAVLVLLAILVWWSSR